MKPGEYKRILEKAAGLNKEAGVSPKFVGKAFSPIVNEFHAKRFEEAIAKAQPWLSHLKDQEGLADDVLKSRNVFQKMRDSVTGVSTESAEAYAKRYAENLRNKNPDAVSAAEEAYKRTVETKVMQDAAKKQTLGTVGKLAIGGGAGLSGAALLSSSGGNNQPTYNPQDYYVY